MFLYTLHLLTFLATAEAWPQLLTTCRLRSHLSHRLPLKFCTDIHGPQRISPDHLYPNILAFSPVPAAEKHFCFWLNDFTAIGWLLSFAVSVVNNWLLFYCEHSRHMWTFMLCSAHSGTSKYRHYRARVSWDGCHIMVLDQGKGSWKLSLAILLAMTFAVSNHLVWIYLGIWDHNYILY